MPGAVRALVLRAKYIKEKGLLQQQLATNIQQAHPQSWYRPPIVFARPAFVQKLKYVLYKILFTWGEMHYTLYSIRQ